MSDNLSLLIQALFLSAQRLTTGNHMSNDCAITEWIRNHHPNVTAEKAHLILSMYRDCWIYSPEGEGKSNIFYPLVHYVQDKAVFKDSNIKVKLKELLRWRQLSCAIGEELLMLTWYAYHFRWTYQEFTTLKYATPCTIDDSDLEYIYQKGLIDLHHHLKASTDVFTLSWICLMNHVTHHYRAFEKMGTDVPLLYKACLEAAQIRARLFEFNQSHQSELLTQNNTKLDDWEMEKSLKSLQLDLNILRKKGSAGTNQPCLDYALPHSIEAKDVSRVYDGEYNLLYTVLRDIFRGTVHQECLTLLLFRYLQIKLSFRKYLVQVNERVGFSNFSDYERRKELFLEGYPEYQQLLSILPVVEGKQLHYLKHLETRIAPKADYGKMNQTLKQLACSWSRVVQNDSLTTGIVVHFIKQEECFEPNHCRHHKLRKTLRRQAIALMALHRNSEMVKSLLVGIDAANTELDCRPEVFAQLYRYIRKKANYQFKTLHYTYHVGEDFYDIVDGLRAIDEAIQFLDMQSGDRLGHCIALGIDPKLYYKEYNHNVIVKKQYLLDNIVWMLHAVKRCSIAVSSHLEMDMKEKYGDLVVELFGRHIPIELYWRAMLLRGDNPYAVSPPQQQCVIDSLLADWNSCALSMDNNLSRLRQNTGILQIYLDYHFNENVRIKGDKMACLKINKEYEELIGQIQLHMMQEICSRNIIIECCPSSNLKIGIANLYEQQPIFRFCPIDDSRKRLPVTVNTDDLGIFQTSIDNEYSLLALSAIKMKDSSERPRYSKQEVIQWIDSLRENGFKYKFN